MDFPAVKEAPQGAGLPMWTSSPLKIPPRAPVLSRCLSPQTTQLCGDLSCSFGHIDLLPVSNWFSVSNVPHGDVFLMCLWGRVSSTSSYSAILPLPQPFFYKNVARVLTECPGVSELLLFRWTERHCPVLCNLQDPARFSHPIAILCLLSLNLDPCI